MITESPRLPQHSPLQTASLSGKGSFKTPPGLCQNTKTGAGVCTSTQAQHISRTEVDDPTHTHNVTCNSSKWGAREGAYLNHSTCRNQQMCAQGEADGAM